MSIENDLGMNGGLKRCPMEWKPHNPYHACDGSMAAAHRDKQSWSVTMEHIHPGISWDDAEKVNISTGKTQRFDISSAHGFAALSYALLTCGFVHEYFEG